MDQETGADGGRRGLLAGGVVVALLAVGLVTALVLTSRAGEPAAAPSPTPSSAPTPTPTEVAIEPAAEPVSEPAPDPIATGEDLAAVWDTLNTYRNWLYAHPDPLLIDEIYAPGCWCHEAEHERLAEMAANGWRHDDGGVQTRRVEVLTEFTQDSVFVEVETYHDHQRVVDADGNTVEEDPGWTRSVYHYVLTRSDGRWRVADVKRIGGREVGSPPQEETTDA